jgi:phospholipase D
MRRIISKLAKNHLPNLRTSAFGLFILGITIGVGYEELVGIGTWHKARLNTDRINVCFTPPSGCGSLIAQQIVDAKHSIYMQAYSLTSQPIIYQLIAAHKRGVKVQILLDRSNLDDRIIQEWRS